MQVMGATFMPVVVSRRDPAYGQQHVLDVLFDDLAVGYSMGRPHGQRLLTWPDFDRLQLTRRELRRRAASMLDAAAEHAQIHGQPPALMLSFDGIESSLLLCDDFWDGLAASVPGQLVIGVPARDVVIVTGSRSATGIAKAARAVDRTLYAGTEHPLRQGLLVRGRGGWEPFAGSPGPAVNPVAAPVAPAPVVPAAMVSAQRAPVQAARPAAPGVRPVPAPLLVSAPPADPRMRPVAMQQSAPPADPRGRPVPVQRSAPPADPRLRPVQQSAPPADPTARPVPQQRSVSAPPADSRVRPVPQQRSVSAPPARRGWLAPAPRQAWSAGR